MEFISLQTIRSFASDIIWYISRVFTVESYQPIPTESFLFWLIISFIIFGYIINIFNYFRKGVIK